MPESLRSQWRRAAAASPDQHSYRISGSRRRSLVYALAGMAHMLLHQKNTRIMALATLLALALGLWLGIDNLRWAILCLAIAMVWLAEFINAAIEAAVNLSAETYHPLARTAKDVAAGAVLLTCITAAIIGLLILGPALIDKLAA